MYYDCVLLFNQTKSLPSCCAWKREEFYGIGQLITPIHIRFCVATLMPLFSSRGCSLFCLVFVQGVFHKLSCFSGFSFLMFCGFDFCMTSFWICGCRRGPVRSSFLVSFCRDVLVFRFFLFVSLLFLKYRTLDFLSLRICLWILDITTNSCVCSTSLGL